FRPRASGTEFRTKSNRKSLRLSIAGPYKGGLRRAAQAVRRGREKGPRVLMISVAALRMQQFGVQFYQASLTARDIDKLVRFEVLSYGDHGSAPGLRGAKNQSKVHWDLLERRIASSEKAYQRQIIRKKIDELVAYYEQCKQARDLPSIPGAVIISCDETLKFEAVAGDPSLGILKVPEREGILRAIDGQHRLLALHAG